jgi:hypothetical protein
MRDTNLEGHAVRYYLPAQAWPLNPFTGAEEPSVHTATRPGEIAYRPAMERGPQGDFYAAGYLIEGFGATEKVVTLRKNYPDSLLAIEMLIIANCQAVVHAAEIFAEQNNGIYPSNVGVDTTPAGDTLTDILGGLLQNPITLAETEPVDGAAAAPGQTGYLVIIQGGFPVGCVVTGWGFWQELITLVSPPDLY